MNLLLTLVNYIKLLFNCVVGLEFCKFHAFIHNEHIANILIQVYKFRWLKPHAIKFPQYRHNGGCRWGPIGLPWKASLIFGCFVVANEIKIFAKKLVSICQEKFKKCCDPWRSWVSKNTVSEECVISLPLSYWCWNSFYVKENDMRSFRRSIPPL